MGARDAGIVYTKRTATNITIQLPLSLGSIEEDYEALVEFPFDSTRKRMSLLVRHLQSGKLWLLAKGADSVMMPRVKLDIAS